MIQSYGWWASTTINVARTIPCKQITDFATIISTNVSAIIIDVACNHNDSSFSSGFRNSRNVSNGSMCCISGSRCCSSSSSTFLTSASQRHNDITRTRGPFSLTTGGRTAVLSPRGPGRVNVLLLAVPLLLRFNPRPQRDKRLIDWWKYNQTCHNSQWHSHGNCWLNSEPEISKCILNLHVCYLHPHSNVCNRVSTYSGLAINHDLAGGGGAGSLP